MYLYAAVKLNLKYYYYYLAANCFKFHLNEVLTVGNQLNTFHFITVPQHLMFIERNTTKLKQASSRKIQEKKLRYIRMKQKKRK